MKITVFGASGKVGRLVVSEAIRRGHAVTAFQRHAPSDKSDALVQIYIGDIYDKQVFGEAIKGSDAVVSTLGSWGTPKKDVLSTAIRHLIPAMREQGITRVVTLTGADARASSDELSLIHRLTRRILSIIGKKVLKDSEEHIRLLKASGLDWTAIRSPVMNKLGDSNRYALSQKRPLPWTTINRRSVAISMIDEIEHASHIRSAPYISRF